MQSLYLISPITYFDIYYIYNVCIYIYVYNVYIWVDEHPFTSHFGVEGFDPYPSIPSRFHQMDQTPGKTMGK